MQKRRHYIPANASSEIPSNMLFVDTESFVHQSDRDHSELTLRLWAAQSVRLEGTLVKSNRFYDDKTSEQFWTLVDEQVQPKKPLWILAHNARFDMRQLQLWKQFDAGRLHYTSRLDSKRHSIMAIDSRPWFIRCEHKSGATVWIVDTMNYWHCSLKELGDMISLPKLTCDVIDATEKQILTYCERDVAIIKKAFVELVCDWQLRNLGNFRTSAAGLSLQNFRHWHCDARAKQINGRLRYNILADPESPEMDFERDGYMGGRIEAFYYGCMERPIYHLDVRSMYPSVMRNGYYPIERVATLTEPEIADLIKMMPARGVMAEVLIDSPHDTYPVRYKKRQHHAYGRFWTILCGRELERACLTGDAVRCNKAVIYRTAPLFKQWVDHWYDLRVESDRIGNQSLSVLSKLILNSLHGKFGQRGVKWQDAKIDPPFIKTGERMRWGTFIDHCYETNLSTQCRVIDGNVMIQEEGTPPDHAFPAISAMISADVRERLRELIEICPEQSVLYTAVDSLIVTEEGYKALLLAGELALNTLGKLRVLGEHKEVEIRSQGCYRLDESWTASGLWGRAEMDYRGAWTAQSWDYNDVFNFDDSGVVYVNRISVNAPRANPKGEMLLDGWMRPYCLGQKKKSDELPIGEQRRLLFEEGE